MFGRIVQLSSIEDTIWSFLSGVKSSGTPVQRSVLAKQCSKDVALLQCICTGTEKCVSLVTNKRHINSVALDGALTTLSFHTALILEVIKMKPPSDVQLRVLYSGLIKGLKAIQYGEIFDQWRQSQVLILSFLSECLKFSKDMIDSLTLVISKSLKNLYATDSSYSRKIRLELIVLLSVLSKSQSVKLQLHRISQAHLF